VRVDFSQNDALLCADDCSLGTCLSSKRVHRVVAAACVMGKALEESLCQHSNCAGDDRLGRLGLCDVS
jgi:hypothetical protein